MPGKIKFKKMKGVSKMRAILVFGIIIITFLFGSNNGYCANVQSNNDNNKGYVFVGTGETQGKTQIGTWTDTEFLKGEKGDKGDKGEQGIDGYTPIKNIDYFDGLNGIDGKDFDPIEVIRLDNRIDNETLSREDADNNLQKQINKNNKRDDRQDKKIQNNTNKINKETQQRKQADKEIRTDLKQETKDRKSADKTLQKNINTETKERKIADRTEKRERILGDKKLQDNINIVDSNSISRDTVLQDNINNVNSRVDNVSNRVDKLEKTQVIAELGVRIFDTKHLSVIPYLQQNFTRQKVSEVGVKCLIKIGKSYEEKLIEDTNSRVKALEKKMGGMPIITKVVDKKGNLISVRIEENGLSVGGEF